MTALDPPLVSPRPQVGSGATVWLTGLPGAGKSTISSLAAELFVSAGQAVYVLDGDKLRTGLNADLGFDRAAREENNRRVGEVANLFTDAGLIVIGALISPYASDRERVRSVHDAAGNRFFEIHVATTLDVCQERDPKGLYAKARVGAVKGLTGVDDPYDIPANPDLRIETAGRTPQESAHELFAFVTAALA
jgi:bifunctional enzyme CysN/CysC